jgi:hypothetical protein
MTVAWRPLLASLVMLASCVQPPAFSRVDGGRDGGAAGAGGSGPDAAVGGAAPAWVWQVSCPDGHDPQDPIDYGRCAVAQSLAAAGTTGDVTIAAIDDPAAAIVRDRLAPALGAAPESFVIAPLQDRTWVVGRDAVGAMYGALQVAESIQLSGPDALPPATVTRGTPAVPFRAANLFWVLPARGESEWWFLDPAFWRDYLDLLAHARMNVLDLHGMYDLESTGFPNALLYLARAASFPDVGAPAADRDRNLATLNRVIAMARARGIRVGLMTYSASSSLDGSAEALSEADRAAYIREAAADVATRAPGLSMLGFRTGESGKPATWYEDTFVAGVRQAGTGTAIYTRSWQSSKPDILSLAAAAGPDMILEAKFNGEHLGPPYAIAGGAMSSWGSYSYQRYLEPPAPWRFVFQVRAGGTHQIFRQASYARTRAAVLSLAMSPRISGFTLEPPHAYTPQRDFYHARAQDQLSPWTFARDDLMYLLWGRLAYDPGEPEARFRAIFAREAGTDQLWPALQAASDIVPWIEIGHTCGPDSRNFEPEMELGGDVAQWAGAAGGPASVSSCSGAAPFDTFAFASAAEAASDLMSGNATSRVRPNDVAIAVLDDAAVAASAGGAGFDPARASVLARDVAREARAVADLGTYFGHKLRAATALAVHAGTGAAPWLDAARAEITIADAGWQSLAADTGYIQPFPERLRMRQLGWDPFHWSFETQSLLASDAAAIGGVAAAASEQASPAELPDPTVWLATGRSPPPALADLTISPADPTATTWTVRARLAGAPDDLTVTVLWKPFDSEVDWTGVPAHLQDDGTWAADITGGGGGALFAVELRSSGGAWRLPDATVGPPYVSLPP